MSMFLVIAFTSAITTEAYVIADNLSKPECIRMMREERKTIMSMEVEDAYLSYMEAFMTMSDEWAWYVPVLFEKL